MYMFKSNPAFSPLSVTMTPFDVDDRLKARRSSEVEKPQLHTNPLPLFFSMHRVAVDVGRSFLHLHRRATARLGRPPR